MNYLVIPVIIQAVGFVMEQEPTQIVEYYSGHSAKKGPGFFFGKLTKEEAKNHRGGIIVAYYALDRRFLKSELVFGKKVKALTEMKYDQKGKLQGYQTTRFEDDGTLTVKNFDAYGRQMP